MATRRPPCQLPLLFLACLSVSHGSTALPRNAVTNSRWAPRAAWRWFPSPGPSTGILNSLHSHSPLWQASTTVAPTQRRVLAQADGLSFRDQDAQMRARGLEAAGEMVQDLPGGRVERLGRILRYTTDTPNESLAVLRLHTQEPTLRAGFFPDQTVGPAPEDELDLSSACQAKPCPALSPCGGSGGAQPVLVCTNPDLEDAPQRVKPRTVVWPYTLDWNGMDLCTKGVSGAAGDVVRPGCPWGENRWQGREEEKGFQGFWRQGGGGQVFVLRDVFLDSNGRVFNSSHLFDAGGCWPRTKFTYPPQTGISEIEEAVNLMVSPFLQDPRPKAGQRSPLLEAFAFELPLLLPVLRALRESSELRNMNSTVLASHNKHFHRWVSAHLLDLDSSRGIFHSVAAPAPGTLWHVKRLVQPVFQACGQPSPALWRQMRLRHLLGKHSVTALQESVPEAGPLVPPSTPLVPHDWVVVVHDCALTAVKDGQQIMSMLARFFPAQRILVLSSKRSVAEDRELLNRAVLFITSSHSGLANVIFMPPNATILDLRVAGQAPQKHAKSELGRALAEACDVRSTVLFCQPGPWSWNKQISCNMEELLGIVDRAAIDAYTAHRFPPVSRIPANRVRSGVDESQLPWFSKPQEEVDLFEKWARCVSEKGQWVYNPTPRLLPWGYQGFINLCDHRHRDAGGLVGKKSDDAVTEGIQAKDWNIRETLKWQWRVAPGACPTSPVTPTGKDIFAEFSGFQFCKRVGKGRTIMFVGDSLQEQFVEVFMNNMLKDIPKPADWAVEHSVPEECKAWLPADWDKPHFFCHEYRFHKDVCRGMRVIFARNDHITLANHRAFDHMQFTRFPFLAEADVLVLNVGPHFCPTPVFARNLEATLTYLRNRFPDLPVVFRNTPPGHKDCEELPAKPLSRRQDPASLPFRWDEFAEQNEVARELVKKHDYVFMDVDTMTALRPDGHKGLKENNMTDCLHYCTPGPQDLWVQHLYNTLMWTHPLPSYSHGNWRQG